MSEKDENIFEHKSKETARRPLADRVRPTKLDEVIGHQNIVGKNSALNKQIQSNFLPSLIFWGPPSQF